MGQLLPSKMAYFKLLILLVPGILGQTHFKKCKGSSDLCFDAKLEKIEVFIGTNGTKKDVVVEFCGDVEVTQCCTTNVLKSRIPFAGNWKSGKNSTFKPNKFGKCKDQTFTIKKDMKVTVKTSGTDSLLVKQIDVYLISADTKVKDDKKPTLELFQCKNYNIGGDKLTQETKACQTGPYHCSQIEKAVFTMGTDGTNNDVNFKIEADGNNLPVKLNCLALLMIGVKAIQKFGSEEILENAKTSFTRSTNSQPSVFQKLEKTI